MPASLKPYLYPKTQSSPSAAETSLERAIFALFSHLATKTLARIAGNFLSIHPAPSQSAFVQPRAEWRGGKSILNASTVKPYTALFVRPAVRILKSMATPSVGIVHAFAPLWQEGSTMNKSEALIRYMTVMSLFREWFIKGEISLADMLRVSDALATKHGLPSCSIYLENDLLYTEERAIYGDVKGGRHEQKNNEN